MTTVPQGGGGVYVSLDTIYNNVQSIGRKMARMDQKLSEIDRKVDELGEDAEKTVNRVTGLERWQYLAMGGSAVFGSVGTLLIQQIMK
jgi:hypothetical protein